MSQSGHRVLGGLPNIAGREYPVFLGTRAGQDRLNEIGSLFMQSVYITMFIALMGIFATYTLAPYIFATFTDPILEEKAMGFLYIRIWGLPFLYLYQMRNALLVGTNQPGRFTAPRWCCSNKADDSCSLCSSTWAASIC